MGTMIKKLLSLFTIKNPTLPQFPVFEYDQDLVNNLEALNRDKTIDKLLTDPVCKIFIINTYSNDFTELGGMLIEPRYKRRLLAINLHTYFKGNESRVSAAFGKIAELIKTTKCSTEGLHDINELIVTINHLKEIKGSSYD